MQMEWLCVYMYAPTMSDYLMYYTLQLASPRTLTSYCWCGITSRFTAAKGEDAWCLIGGNQNLMVAWDHVRSVCICVHGMVIECMERCNKWLDGHEDLQLGQMLRGHQWIIPNCCQSAFSGFTILTKLHGYKNKSQFHYTLALSTSASAQANTCTYLSTLHYIILVTVDRTVYQQQYQVEHFVTWDICM